MGTVEVVINGFSFILKTLISVYKPYGEMFRPIRFTVTQYDQIGRHVILQKLRQKIEDKKKLDRLYQISFSFLDRRPNNKKKKVILLMEKFLLCPQFHEEKK